MGEMSEDKEQHNSPFVIACIFPVDIYLSTNYF